MNNPIHTRCLFKRSSGQNAKWKFGILAIFLFALLLPMGIAAQTIPTQIVHPDIEKWPRQPEPFEEFDWKKRFLAFDEYIFDWDKQSEFPTIRLDTTSYNMEGNTVYIPAYIGDERMSIDGYQDGLTFIALVVGSALNGRDKDSVLVGNQVYNYVDMLKTFQHDYGYRKTFFSFPQPSHARNQSDWWYDVGPSLLYFMVGDLYPGEPGMDERLRRVADGFYEMIENLGGENVDFWHQAYNHDMKRPINSITWNGHTHAWKVPEIGILAAAIEYWTYKKFGEEKYLRAAKWSMDYYEKLEKNPYYEIALSLGPYMASMMNAEQGTHYNATKYIDWILKGSDVRTGYGTVEANWNGYDVYGLVGSRQDLKGEGYVFALETFINAFLAPAVKYDGRLARITGKWLLNASNASRFFYPDQLPAENQYYGDKYIDAPEHVVPYEGLRITEDGQSPRATGDAVAYNDIWASFGPTFDVGEDCTNMSIYGGAWAGFFGAVLSNTNIPKILQINLNALDFFSDNSQYPSYMYYNPYTSKKTVEITVEKRSDVYNVLTKKYIERNAIGKISFDVPADDVVSLLIVPAKSKIALEGHAILVNGTKVSYTPQ